MALAVYDRVRETTTTTGTGTITLLGAVVGYQTFDVIGNGNTTYYTIAGQGTTEWEVGIGTYTLSGTTLTRTTVLSNSLGTTVPVSFSAGTKDVFVTYPSEKAVYLDASGNATLTGNLSVTGTLGVTGVATLTSKPILSSLTASQAVFSDASKGLVSNAITGTGNVVMSASPTLTGTVAGASLSLSSLTSGRVTYAGTAGLLQDSANLTFNGTTLTANTIGAFTLGGIVAGGGNQINNVVIGTSTPLAGTFTNLAYTGTLTGGTGVVNLGSGQFYKDASGNVGIGTSSPTTKLEVSSGTTNTTIRATNTTSGFEIQSNSNDGYINMTGTGNTIFRNGAGFTERMRLDSSGNLGLGVTPSAWVSTAKVLVLGSTQSGTIAALSGGSFSMENNSYTNTSGVGTYIATGYATRYYQSSTGTHVWNTAPAGTAGNAITFTQAMTLHASGGLSLGNTTDPGQPTLSVTGTLTGPIEGLFTNASTGNNASAGVRGIANSTGYFGLRQYGTGVITTGFGVALANYSLLFTDGAASNGLIIGAVTADPVIFGTNNAERMRIDSSGNVGIGLIPSAYDLAGYTALEVGKAGSGIFNGAGDIYFTQNAYYNTSQWRYGATGVGAGIYGINNNIHSWRIASAGTAGGAITWVTPMTLDASGNLGLGTTTPTNYAGYTSFVLNDTTGGIIDLNVSGTRTGSLYATASLVNLSSRTAIPIVFETNATEKMRIDSSGNLLVGTTSSSGKATINAGTTSATTYNTVSRIGGSSVTSQQQSTSVSTSATVILTPNLYASFCVVFGSDGTNRFMDLILCTLGSGTVQVVASSIVSGAPAVRIYDQSSSAYRLTMASGTYTVQVSATSMTG